MKIAVTGASGFIGRHVLLELEKRSLVSNIVIRPTFKDSNSLCKNTVIQLDLQNPPPNAFKLIGSPDILIHLAWGGLPNYQSLHHFEKELPEQYRFLKILIESGLKNLIVAGTCFEYGNQTGALNEDSRAEPNNPYGFAKDVLRRQLEFLKINNPFKLTWARLFYLYGEGQSEKSLYSQFNSAINQKDEVFNLSGGEQIRDYLPVSELAEYLVSLTMKNQDNGIVNVCSGNPISIRKLVEGWLEKKQSKMKLNFGFYPYTDYEPMSFWGECQKMKRILEIK